MEQETLQTIVDRFIEKNPTFVRICSELFFVRFKNIEVSQGRVTKYEIEQAHSKEVKNAEG